MPNRILREGILTSQRVDQLSFGAEILYRRLMSVVDDYGRFYGDPVLIRASCYPRKIDQLTNSQIEDWLHECSSSNPIIILYSIDGKSYLQINNFNQRVRAASKYPAPTGTTDKEPERAGKVYFIRAKSSGHIKIGYTEWKPESRVAALQAGSSERLELVAWKLGSQQDERDLQRKFTADAIGGEWFAASSELVKFIAAIGKQPPTNADISGQQSAQSESYSESYSESEATSESGGELPPLTPQNEKNQPSVAWMQSALHEYVKACRGPCQAWSEPDEVICQKVLIEAPGRTVGDLTRWLKVMYSSGEMPDRSYAWFVSKARARYAPRQKGGLSQIGQDSIPETAANS